MPDHTPQIGNASSHTSKSIEDEMDGEIEIEGEEEKETTGT